MAFGVRVCWRVLLQELEFIIHADGRVEERVRGVKGIECQSLTEVFNKALGEVYETKATQEMFEQKVEISVEAENTVSESWSGSGSVSTRTRTRAHAHAPCRSLLLCDDCLCSGAAANRPRSRVAAANGRAGRTRAHLPRARGQSRCAPVEREHYGRWLVSPLWEHTCRSSSPRVAPPQCGGCVARRGPASRSADSMPVWARCTVYIIWCFVIVRRWCGMCVVSGVIV